MFSQRAFVHVVVEVGNLRALGLAVTEIILTALGVKWKIPGWLMELG